MTISLGFRWWTIFYLIRKFQQNHSRVVEGSWQGSSPYACKHTNDCKPKRKISSAIISPGFIWGPVLSLGCTRRYANEQGGWRFSIPNHEQKELPQWTSRVGGLTIELPDHFILFPHVSTIGSYKWWGPRPSLTSKYRSEFQPLKGTFFAGLRLTIASTCWFI